MRKLSFHQGILSVRLAKLHGKIIYPLEKQLVLIEVDDEHRTDNEIQDPNLENHEVARLKRHREVLDPDRLPRGEVVLGHLWLRGVRDKGHGELVLPSLFKRTRKTKTFMNSRSKSLRIISWVRRYDSGVPFHSRVVFTQIEGNHLPIFKVPFMFTVSNSSKHYSQSKMHKHSPLIRLKDILNIRPFNPHPLSFPSPNIFSNFPIFPSKLPILFS